MQAAVYPPQPQPQPQAVPQHPQQMAVSPVEARAFLRYHDLYIVKTLSQSPRALVFLVKDSQEKQTVVKVGPLTGHLQFEGLSLKQFAHPNVVSMIDSYVNDSTLYIHLEKAEGRCLIDVVSQGGPLLEVEAKMIISQVVSALIYIHSKGWVHRDVKPDNMIYDLETGAVKLIDFEFASKYSKHSLLRDPVGTLAYSSPELRMKRYQGPEVDVWSLGVTVYVLLSAAFPFDSDSLRKHTEVFRCPTEFSPECQDLLHRMLSKNVEKRIKMKEIVLHDWLRTLQQPQNRGTFLQRIRTVSQCLTVKRRSNMK